MSSSMDEFLNLDMLAPAANDSDNSPDSAFLGLPPTPPSAVTGDNVPAVSDGSDLQDFFKFYFDQSLDKMAVAPVPAAEAASFTFMDSFSPAEPSSSSATSASPALDDVYFFAIDPQLMAAPSPQPRAVRNLRVQTPASTGDDDDDEDEDDDMDDVNDLIAPVKLGGRGKNSRKGTVSGGIKKFGGQAVKDDNDPDDWRPTVDEYKKMTSKEKRQLRNKISARNFRVRRKEYITTLEGDVADRDRMIELIREELGATKLENESLRREVDALKKAMLEGRVAPNLPPPAPLDAVKAATDAATNGNKRTTRSKGTPLARANTQKDLPTSSPRNASARAFWGGASSGAYTPVHTTLVPDFPSLISAQLAEKSAFSDVSTFSGLQLQQENINPALNSSPFTNRTVQGIAQPPIGGPANGFDNFTDLNPFTLKNLESYRMQLWGKMAREMPTPSAVNAALPQGLARNAKPLFLASPTNRRMISAPAPSLVEILSGKSSAKIPSTSSAKPDPSLLATMASETLLQRMTGAFWDAFSSPSPSTSASSSKKADWDTDKVRRVLEGKAVLRVVDLEDEKPKLPERVADPAAALEESMRALSLQRQDTNATNGSRATKDEDSGAALAGVFAGLRLGARRSTPPAQS